MTNKETTAFFFAHFDELKQEYLALFREQLMK